MAAVARVPFPGRDEPEQIEQQKDEGPELKRRGCGLHDRPVAPLPPAVIHKVTVLVPYSRERSEGTPVAPAFRVYLPAMVSSSASKSSRREYSIMTRPRPLLSSIATFRPSARCSGPAPRGHWDRAAPSPFVHPWLLFRVQHALHVALRLAHRHGECVTFCAAFRMASGDSRPAACGRGRSSVSRSRPCAALRGQAQQPQEVRDRGAVLAGALRHLFLGHLEVRPSRS